MTDMQPPPGSPMNSVPQLLQSALQHHQSGNLHRAELLYRQILQIDSRHADALHLLGLIAHQVGKNELAVDYIQQALRLLPRFPAAHNNLATVLKAQGKLADAIASYRLALSMKPDFAEAHHNLGIALQEQGKLAEATASYRLALSLNPDYAEAHNNLGNVLKEQGKLEEAADSFRQALRLRPNDAQTHNNLGVALRAQGKHEEALFSYRQALRLHVHVAEAHYRRVLSLKPDDAEAYYKLGVTLMLQGKAEEAIVSYQQALLLQPDNAEAHVNLGNVLREQGRLEEAIACYRQAPAISEAQRGLGLACMQLGQLDEAIAAFRRAADLNPSQHTAGTNLLYAINFHPGWAPEQIAAEHRRWAATHADHLAAAAPSFANDPSSDRVLRIGYVSSCFRDHAVNFFIEPVLAAHDGRSFQVVCYSDLAVADEVTRKLQAMAHEWQSIYGLSDAQVAAQIRRDRIDILVDLNGHMGTSRLLAFARPAPIQVAYLGYQATTGMAAMDYRLTDAHADPPGVTDGWHTETLVRLPIFFCYRPTAESPACVPPPSSRQWGGLGAVTFGSFNNFAKITPQVLAVWAEILNQLPDARLQLLIPKSESIQERVLTQMGALGISPRRLIFAARGPRTEYLERYQTVDIALDPFPFNGHTTTCDALWMGVPVVSMCGQSYVQRFGTTALIALGLEDLIARNPPEYIAAALRGPGIHGVWPTRAPPCGSAWPIRHCSTVAASPHS